MKIVIDTDLKKVGCESSCGLQQIDLYSKQAFELLSELWVKVGWNEKYQYTFTWLGRPVIQLPEDLLRIQEVIYSVKPDVIIETGIAHGGSLIFYASLCKAMNKGRVIGIDIELRPKNRKVLEEHELYPFITLVEGNSTDEQVVRKVRDLVGSEDKVLVILDSCHTQDHVYRELEAYSGLVTLGSYIVATDGIMHQLQEVPRGKAEWVHNNPRSAALAFAAAHPEFVLGEPSWAFNESSLEKNITHWDSAWLKRME